jgi:CHAD domain-containing protein
MSAPTATPFFAKKLRALDAEIARNAPRVLRSARAPHLDPEAIHDLRVAIRRLRTLLKLGRRVFGRRLADAVRRALADVQRATGDLRDEEVLSETLSEIPQDGLAFHAWRRRRAARERRLRREVVSLLRAADLRRARAMLRGLLLFPVKKPRELHPLARGSVERARARVERLRDVASSDAEGLHELRIAYKELRYASELLAEALPADLAAMAEPAAKFQKRLGEIHDVDVAIATLERARFDPSARAAVLADLAILREKRVKKYLAEMAPPVSEEALSP